MLKRVQIILSLLVSVVCLYFAFRGIDWSETWKALKSANYIYVVATVVVSLGSVWIRAWRWKFMLDPVKKVRVSGLFASTMIGFMANNILPARLGEFVRAYAVGRIFRVSKSAAFATIVIERAFDLFTLVLCLGIVLLLVPLEKMRPIRPIGLLAIVFCILTFAILIFFRQRRTMVAGYMGGVLRRFPDRSRSRADRLLHSFIDGLEVLTRGQHIIAIVVASLVMWASVAWSLDLAMRAFSFRVPYYASLVLLVVVSLGLMIPSGPGFAGTFEAAVIWSLLLFQGITKEQAVSYAIMYHATQFLPITVIGFYYLWKSNLSLSDATRAEAPQEKG